MISRKVQMRMINLDDSQKDICTSADMNKCTEQNKVFSIAKGYLNC